MNRTAKNRSWIVATVVIVSVGAYASIGGRISADDKKADAAVEKSDLAKNLIGTWTLAETEGPAGSPSGIGTRLKFFTGTHWMITQPDPKTGEVVFHHGGRYTLDGDTLAGTIDFANQNTAGLIGQTHKFKIKVDGDTYTQVGQGNPYNETWKRVK
jgi:hypothetical protein